jgi:hypothetical protein
MPYIKQVDRAILDVHINAIVDRLDGPGKDEIDVPGNLNYIIFAIVKRYLAKHGMKYFRINAIIGALECCKQEIYRRLAGPYEDTAIERNGDVTL